jgi:hypothetical protein
MAFFIFQKTGEHTPMSTKSVSVYVEHFSKQHYAIQAHEALYQFKLEVD